MVAGRHIDDVLVVALARVVLPWSARSSITIDMEGHGREDLGSDIDLSRTVGWFTAISPVRIGTEPSDTFLESVRSVGDQLAARPQRGLGFGAMRYLSDDAAVRAASATSSAADQFQLPRPVRRIGQRCGDPRCRRVQRADAPRRRRTHAPDRSRLQRQRPPTRVRGVSVGTCTTNRRFGGSPSDCATNCGRRWPISTTPGPCPIGSLTHRSRSRPI